MKGKTDIGERRGKNSTYANRGKAMEQMVLRANIVYEDTGVAQVHQNHVKWQPIRDGSGKISSAKVNENAPVDFDGFLMGGAVVGL